MARIFQEERFFGNDPKKNILRVREWEGLCEKKVKQIRMETTKGEEKESQ